MKKTALIILIMGCASIVFCQVRDSTDTVDISDMAIETLKKFEEAIMKIHTEQEMYLRGVIEQEGLNFEAIKRKIIKFENGKIIYVEN
jgi:hypothetical protein